MKFTFSVFDYKYLSWANLVQKSKIVLKFDTKTSLNMQNSVLGQLPLRYPSPLKIAPSP